MEAVPLALVVAEGRVFLACFLSQGQPSSSFLGVCCLSLPSHMLEHPRYRKTISGVHTAPCILQVFALHSFPIEIDEAEADTRSWTSLGSGTGCGLSPKPLFSCSSKGCLLTSFALVFSI